MQVKLAQEQIEAFYHDNFVTAQVADFKSLIDNSGLTADDVTDVGGGVGHFAEAIRKETSARVRVVDMDPVSVEACRTKGVPAVCGDALNPPISGQEKVACFNLILHHLVGRSEHEAMSLQSKALSAWRGRVPAVFVNEYIYDSYFGTLSGRLIYWITSSSILSAIGRLVSVAVPSLRANTFGIGVRFRARSEWEAVFQRLGFEVVGAVRGPEEDVSIARRMLLIKSCRRDSFLLVSK